MIKKQLVIVAIFLALNIQAFAGDKYGKFQIDTRGNNPSRLKWEDVYEVFHKFEEPVREQYREFSRETHDFFHGKFKDYFPNLPEDVRTSLEAAYPLLLVGGKLKETYTFEEIFQVGEAPDSLLFPLTYSVRKATSTSLTSLQGLMLRGKSGEEKGEIITPWEKLSPYTSLGGNDGYKVRTRNGEEKEEYGFAQDALTVRWSDIANKNFINLRLFAE